jgi:hypothetical protein
MQAILLNKSDIENMVELDSLPPLKVQIIGDDGNPYALTGASLYLALVEKLSTGNVLKFKKAFTITAALSGLAEYRWANTQLVKDLDKPGKFIFDIILQQDDTPAVIAALAAVGGPTSTVTGTSGGVFTGAGDCTYNLEVTTGGTWGVAVLKITSTGVEAVDTTVQPANGVDFAVGTYGVLGNFVPNSGGNFVLGDKWTISAAALIPGGRRTLTKESATLTVRSALATT